MSTPTPTPTPAPLSPEREAEIREKFERESAAVEAMAYVSPGFSAIRDLLAELDWTRDEATRLSEELTAAIKDRQKAAETVAYCIRRFLDLEGGA